jgi:hypothetical protein
MKTAGLLISFLVSATALFAEDTPKPEAPPPSVLKRYDKNKDGKLDEKESEKWRADLAARREKAAAERKARLEKFDADKDGKLSDDEKAAAKLSMTKARLEADLAKGKEKADARIAREQAEKAKTESAATTADSPTPPPSPATAPTMGDEPAKPDATKPGESMMMME